MLCWSQVQVLQALLDRRVPTIPSAQAIAYVQELDEEVSNVFHDEHRNIWSYVTIASPYRQGALGSDNVVRLKEAETS